MMKQEVLREYELASADPKKHLQNFKAKEMASVAQIEIIEGRQLLRRDGTVVPAAMKVMKLDDDPVPKRLSAKEEAATVIGRDLQALLSPSMPNNVRSEIMKKYIEYKITQVEDYGISSDVEADEIIPLNKISVVDGEVIEDVEVETDKDEKCDDKWL